MHLPAGESNSIGTLRLVGTTASWTGRNSLGSDRSLESCSWFGPSALNPSQTTHHNSSQVETSSEGTGSALGPDNRLDQSLEPFGSTFDRNRTQIAHHHSSRVESSIVDCYTSQTVHCNCMRVEPSTAGTEWTDRSSG